MKTASLIADYQDIEAANTQKPTRLYFIDWIKVFLVTSVVWYHSDYYMYRGWWLMHSLEMEPWMKQFSRFFLGLQQCYFMTLFFFLAGLFVSKSYDRKGSFKYLKMRAVRLLTPVLFYEFLLAPSILWVCKNIESERDFLGIYRNYMKVFRFAKDPMWFPVLLFMFDCLYCLSRSIPAVNEYYQELRKLPGEKSAFSYWYMIKLSCKAWAIITWACFFMRVWHGYGKWYAVVGQAAFLPVYLFAHIFGTVVSSNNFIIRIPKKFGYFGGVSGLVIFFIRFYVTQIHPYKWLRRFNEWQFTATSLECASCLLFSTFVICIFREFLNFTPARVGKAIIGASYTVYLTHLAFVFPFIYLFNKSWPASTILRFLVCGILSSLLAWVSAVLIKLIPFVNQVL